MIWNVRILVLKNVTFSIEVKCDDSGWAIALLCYNNFSLPFVLSIRVVDLISIQEHNGVSILLD